MMQQSMRSQTPGMTPVPNNQGMPGQPPRMGGGPQGNVSWNFKLAIGSLYFFVY